MPAKTATPNPLLQSGVVPAKKSGRKPKEVDADLLAALTDALSNAKIVDGRPEYFGPVTLFDTEGKATAEARRYVKSLTENSDAPFHGQQISVRAIDAGNEKFQWAVYRRVKNSDGNSASA